MFQQLKSIGFGHFNVEENQVGTVFLYKQNRRINRLGFTHQINLGAVLPQNTGKVFAAMFFVVNNDGFDSHTF
jgi:hypothetical protein